MVATDDPAPAGRGAALRERAASLHRTGGSWLVAASVVSGVGAYAFQLLGSRVLGEEAFAPIGVLWTIQYLAFSVLLFGVETFLARAITLHGDDPAYLRRTVAGLVAWSLGCAALLTAVTWWWRDRLFSGSGDLPLVVGAVVVTYGAFMLVRGGLAGQRRFHSYGTATALESLVRLAAAVPALAIAATTRSLAWAMPVGAAVAACWWLPAQRHPREPTDALSPEPVPVTAPAGFLVLVTVANAASQALLAAGPLVLVALEATPAQVSVLFVTVTLFRVPIVLAYGGVLSRALPSLTRLVRSGRTRLVRRVVDGTAAGALVLAAVGGVVAYGIGAPLVGLLFGADFAPPAAVAAATAAGVVLASGALLLNQVLIAQSAERRLVAPWLAGLAAAAVAIAAGTAPPLLRVAQAFVAGEVVAILGLALAARTARTTEVVLDK